MNCIDQMIGKNYALYRGDCVEVLEGLPSASIGYSIFSPPFSSLYTYSNSPRDMGNVRNDKEFFEHFDYLVQQLARVMRPCRNVSFHCMLLPTSKQKDGVIGLKDFRGDMIKAFERRGFTHHSEVVIWKNPVTKALGLLHKTVRGNAAMSRNGIADYLITMRSPGEPDTRITNDAEDYPVSEWQKIASPVWMDINPSDTLQYRSARDHNDERHIAPLQLEVIRRGIRLWSSLDDVVLTPFMGIGSECVVALELKRKTIGIELKESYYKQATLNVATQMRTRVRVPMV
jgi:DNA modification methylase